MGMGMGTGMGMLMGIVSQLLWLIALVSFQIAVEGQNCPKVCTCEFAPLSQLPISSLLAAVQHSHPSEEKQPSYQQQNEVLYEQDDHETVHKWAQDRFEAATCVLQPEDNMPLFHALPPSLQALTLLQGPGTPNITLDGSHFQLLLNLVVLEIHGYQDTHGKVVMRVRSDAFRGLDNLQYINLQHLHLLGNGNIGNRPVPAAMAKAFSASLRNNMESNNLMESSEQQPDIVPYSVYKEHQAPDIVPYSVYKEQQERDGLSMFAGLQNLVFLRAYRCNIKEVNWEMFDGLQQLEYLSLEGNNIQFLHEFAFYGTPNLKRLTLSHNDLLQVQSIDLAGLLNLEILDLSYNNISHLSELTLPPFPKLVMADFHHNPIELILPHTFEVMNETEQLFLGGNHARLYIHPHAFTGLDNLHKLSISGLNVEVLERDYLKGMPKLQELRLAGVIQELSYDAFVEVPKLLELIMKHCAIRKISMDAFYGLYGLVYLDLSHNAIEMLPPSLFDHQTSLKELNLHNNMLTTLPEAIFSNIPAKMIRLDKNPWHCTCAMDEWQPSQINNVKVKTIDKTKCQTRYDKGSMCKVHYKNRYIYEHSVSPKCVTPSRFAGWSVFHLLRKHLRCHEKLHKYKVKWQNNKMKPNKPYKTIYSDTKFYKTNNLTETKSITNGHNSLLETHLTHVELHNKTKLNNTEQILELNSDTKHRESEQVVDQNNRTTHNDIQRVHELNKNTNTSINRTGDSNSSIPEDNELNSFNKQETNDYLWTQKDKDKYKLLQRKEETTLKRYNIITPIQRDNEIASLTKVLDKTNKKYETKKKWETKMNDTMRRLSTTQSNNNP